MTRASAGIFDDQSVAGRRHAPTTEPTLTTPEGNGAATQFDKIDESRRRRQISHDIRHELGTIMMLTSVLSSSEDIGRHGRTRARQILGQTRFLDERFRAYDDGLVTMPASQEPVLPGIRLDTVAADIVRPIRLSASTRITYDAIEISANVDRLGFWRTLWNIIGDAVEAAGPHGTVAVRISAVDGFAVVDVDVDGPTSMQRNRRLHSASALPASSSARSVVSCRFAAETSAAGASACFFPQLPMATQRCRGYRMRNLICRRNLD